MTQEFYLNYNIKCCNALSEYEKGLMNCTDNNIKTIFNKNWIIKNKFIFKKIINKPVGLPAILLSNSKNYLYIYEFYKLFNLLNLNIITDDDLDRI